MKIYLTKLSFSQDEDCFKSLLSCVLSKRREKICKLKNKEGRFRSLFAGLLFGYALEDFLSEYKNSKNSGFKDVENDENPDERIVKDDSSLKSSVNKEKQSRRSDNKKDKKTNEKTDGKINETINKKTYENKVVSLSENELIKRALEKDRPLFPLGLSLRYGAHGKPFLDFSCFDDLYHDARLGHDGENICLEQYGQISSLADSPLSIPYFSISHSGNFCCCAVSDKPCGADIQCARTVSESMIKKCCSERELADLSLFEGGERLERFFKYWVLKEAYIKADGRGLLLPLNKISFCIKNKSHGHSSDGDDLGFDGTVFEYSDFGDADFKDIAFEDTVFENPAFENLNPDETDLYTPSEICLFSPCRDYFCAAIDILQ